MYNQNRKENLVQTLIEHMTRSQTGMRAVTQNLSWL